MESDFRSGMVKSWQLGDWMDGEDTNKLKMSFMQLIFSTFINKIIFLIFKEFIFLPKIFLNILTDQT